MDDLQQELSPLDQKIDVLIDNMIQLQQVVQETIKHHGENKQTQTIIHKSEGSSTLAIVCAAISVLSLLGIFGVAWSVSIEIGKQTRDISDLRAWRDVHQNQINDLKVQLTTKQEKRP